jgi:tetratricopeptide (TPR) repeat protein
MNNHISTALATLRSDPDDVQSLRVLADLKPGDESVAERESLQAALTAERLWHTDREQVITVLALLDADLALGGDNLRRATLLVEKARLEFRELCRADVALLVANQADEAVPHYPPAVEWKRGVDDEQRDWKARAEDLVREAEGSKEGAAASLLAAAGELYLRFDPSSDQGESLLRRSLSVDPRQHRADVLLERGFRLAKRHDDLAALLKARVEAAATPADRAAAETAWGHLERALGRRDQAMEHYRQALAAAPADERAVGGLGLVLTADENWAELAKVYEAALRVPKRPNEAALLIVLGELYWKRLNRVDDAEACLRRAKKTQPFHPTLIAFYRDYHLQRDEIPKVLALLGQAQKAETDPEARIRYGIEMAELAERKPQLIEKAIDAWKALLRMRAGQPDAVAALRRLYTRTEKWNALLELLKDQCEALPADAVDEKVQRYLEMIPIYRDHLRLEVAVVNTYTAILNLRPDHAEALKALGERYEAQGRWGDLANVLARQAQASGDKAEKLAHYHRIASLWVEKFNNHHNAMVALEKILEISPADTQARTALREIHTRGRSWRPLLELMRRELPLLEPEARRNQLCEMAALAADRLSDPRQAIGLWNEVLELRPDDGVAVSALATLYERDKRWPALAEVLGRLAEAAGGETSTEGCALLEKRGLILQERVGAFEAALASLRRVQSVQPDNPRVVRAMREALCHLGDFTGLEALYGGRGAWEELCEVLSQVAERTGDKGVRIRLLGRVAEVARDKLNQPERVLKAYEGILASDPENRDVAAAAAQLYQKTQRWGRLVATFEILLGPEDKPALSVSESLPILERARTICETKLDSKALAFQWCARAYRLAPTDATVYAELDRLGTETEEWDGLLRLFADRLSTYGEGAPDDDERMRLLRRCLNITSERLDRADEVKRFAEAILEKVPADAEAEGALLKLYTRLERWAELVALQQIRQRRIEDPALRVELLLRLAHTQQDRLNDRKAAEATLSEAIAVDPANRRVLRELVQVRVALGYHVGLAEALSRLSEVCPEDERPKVLLRLARLQEVELGQPDLATAAYLRVLELDNISAEAVEGLERLLDAEAVRREDLATVASALLPYYELTERFEKWARTLEALASVTSDMSERNSQLEMLADLYQGPLADPVAAFGAVLRVFEADSTALAIRERLISLAAEANRLPELTAAVRRVLDKTDEPLLRQQILMLLAEVEDRQPDHKAEAETALREVLQIDPLHMGAYRALSRLFRDGERWGALRDVVEAREGHVPDVRERLEMLWQIVEIDEALIYDQAHATDILRRIVELDPKDLRACRSLERNYVAAERWRDLDELLVHEMALVPRQELPDLKLRRAELSLVRFDDARSTLDLLDEVLAMAPNHPQVITWLERVVDVPEQRRRAAATLEPLYQAAANWPRLLAMLDIAREGCEPAAASDILIRKAEIQEQKLTNAVDAWETWQAVLAIDPHSQRALSESERLAATLGRLPDLVATYMRLADKRDASDVGGVADLLSRAARLYAAGLADTDAAMRTWRRVLDLDPSNPGIGGEAAAALETMYSDATDIKGLVHVLRCKAEWAEDARARGEIVLRIAELEETLLEDQAAAIATYSSLLDGEGQQVEKAFDQLERIYQKAGMARERVELLKRRVEWVAPERRRDLRHRMAGILENELKDLDEAIATVRPVLDEAPEDLEALKTLARMYDAKGAAVEHLEILERLLLLASTPLERVERLRQIATILQGPLARPSEALERWREILRIVPTDAGALAEMERLLGADDVTLRYAAAEILAPIYEAASDGPRMARVLSIFIELDEDGRARAGHRSRLAHIQEKLLGDKKAAFATWASAIRDGTADPELGQLLDSYERLALLLGPENVIEIIELYKAVEPDVLAEDTRLRLQRTIAEHAVDLGDLALATDYYNRLSERRPDDDSALVALESIYRKQDNQAALYEVILRRAELASSSKAEIGLRREAGQLATRLDRKDEAIAAWERVWELHPGATDAVQALDALYTELQRWDDLVMLLERRMERATGVGEGTDLRFRLAEVHRQQLGNRERALDYLTQVLQREPDHAPSVAILQELLHDPDVCVEAANLLEPVFVQRNAWKDLVEIDSLRLKHSEDPERRLTWTQRIARVYEEQIEDLNEAFNWYGRVFEERPTDPDAQEQLLRLAPKLSRWADLGHLLDDYLDNELSNSDDVLALVRMAIRVYDQELNDREAARRHFRRYIEAQMGDRSAAELYEEALERWESWGELRDLLEDQVARVEEPAERVALLHRSAAISEEKLNAPETAMDSLRAILGIDPDDAPAAAALERILAGEERWEELRDHLAWMLGRAETTAAKDAITMDLAEVEGKRLGNWTAAVEHYGEVLARTATHTNAMIALDGMLGEPEQRARVAELLEPAYRNVGNLRKLADTLHVRLETMDEVSQRVEAFREIAAVEAHVGRPVEALEARGRAWLEDVSNRTLLAELQEETAVSNGWARLVQLLQQGAEATLDPDLRADLYALKASVLETRLGSPEQAIGAWREAIEARPEDLDAFAALERLLAEANRTEELCEILEKHAEVVVDAREREALTKRLAVLLESPLGKIDRAIAAWRNVLDLDLENQEALLALTRLYTQTEDWANLAEVVQRRIEACKQAPQLLDLHFQAADLHDEKLNDATEAANHLRAILEFDPENGRALTSLSRIYGRDGHHADLVDVLDIRVRAANQPVERDALAFQAAQLVQNELSDSAGAIERYRTILQRTPDHAESRTVLWDLARDEDRRMLAIGVLEPVLRAGQEWAALVQLLELRFAGEDVPAQRMETLAAISVIQEEHLRDGSAAFATWARAMAEEPTDANARAALERLATACGSWSDLARVFEERMKATYDAELQASLGARLADLYERVLGNPDRAVELWRDVASLPGGEATALTHLEVLLRSLGRHGDLEDILSRQAELAVEPSVQADYWCALGDLRLHQLNKLDDGVEAFHAALERVPTHAGALTALRELVRLGSASATVLDILEPLAEARGDHAELVGLCEARISRADDAGERASLLRRLAELAENQMNDLPRALAALGRSLREDPSASETVDAIERVAERASAPAEAARLIEAVLDALDGDALVQTGLRAANLFVGAGTVCDGDAERLYTRVLNVDPENATALEAVESLYRRRGDSVQLAATLERRGALELDPKRRLAFYGEAARLHELRADLESAITAWRAGRDGDETNLEAIDEIARLCEAAAKIDDWVEILSEKARVLDDARERAAVHVLIGQIRAQAQGDKDGAAASFREALDIAPDDKAAMIALVEMEEERGDYPALEEALLRQLSTVTGADQVPVLKALARNASLNLKDSDRALVYLHQILEANSEDRDAFAEMKRVLTSLERWHELIETLEQRAAIEARLGNAEAELACRVEVAEIWGEKLGAADSALDALQAVLARNPKHLSSWLAVARIHETEERWAEAGEAIDKAAELATTPKDRAELLCRRARIRSATGSTLDAIEGLYQSALDNDASCVAAMEALQELARLTGNSSRLVHWLELEEPLANGEDRRKSILSEIASLYLGPLGKPGDAVAHLEKLVKLAPADVASQENLGRALLAAGRIDEGEYVFLQLLEVFGKNKQPKNVVRLQVMLGGFAETRGDFAGAKQRFLAAYQIDPTQAQTLAALARLSLKQSDGESARKFYRTLLLQSFDEKAVGLTKAEIYLALGRLHLDAGETPKARNMFERGLELDPKNQSLVAALAATPK